MRNRLMGAVAVVAAAVLGAGAPALIGAADQAQSGQHLVDLAELDSRAVALAHSLADERDSMTEYVATGRSAQSGAGASEAQRSRVDRQLRDLRSEAQDASGDTPGYVAAEKLLAALPQTRQEALSGSGPAEDTFASYTRVVQALGAISEDIARALPARDDGADADTRALPSLGRAVDQAAATRALLLAALHAGGPQAKLTGAAQLTHLREQGALADFAQLASEKAQDSYDSTVNGADVTTAERYLTRLTDQPHLDAADLSLSRERVQSTLTARIGLMRGVESAMATQDVQRLAALRDDDVTALEIRIGLVGLCLLLAVGISISAARSMTRPLAALRLGAKRIAADPAHEAPLAFKGRNDEFADAVRAVNALHTQVGEVARRTAELEGERGRLITGRQRLADEREVLNDERAALKQEVAALTERLAALRSGVHGRFVNLSLRTVGLVERQLGVIESLEEREQDPERLETLFKLDHFAARMRRNSENLLVLAGAEHGSGHPGPVPLLDVLRASVSEIERYDRVRIQSLPPHSQVAGFAADDISHLVAELLENATAFSPPDAHVELSGWLLESGEVMLSVQDQGIGMTADRLAELNDRLADAEEASTSETVDESLGLGLYVVVRLAARHGVRVQLRAQNQGGVTAVVVLPGSILPTRPGPAGTRSPGADEHAAGPTLPGSVAEANSNTLQTRLPRLDPATGAPATGAPAAPAAPAPGRQAPAAPVPVPAQQADPLVAAAERAIDAAGIQPRPHPQHGTPQGPGPVAPYAEAAPTGPASPAAPAAPQGPTTSSAPGPSPYGPLSSGPYATGATEHSRPDDVPPAAVPGQDHRPAPGDAPGTPQTTAPDAAPAGPAAPAGEGRRTDMGLPKRTPKVVAQQQAPAAPRKSGAANAEALRRRLGGFQQGARTGRRDVEAEIAERTAEQTIPQTDTDGAGAPGESHVVEEARD
ncbi:sensor histidine kinase [Streptomyces pinistramenti]|uniref:sensor histidine kinase n=1 Tax=Streptomyces pinistramenti TaxID=2884812 RepID=UPI001D07275E|nr:nitrate- and nitrite sensing domain-containing protein [Streptomyces pinistramenti]MCB5908700.1 nitrate- and nitrite sensing domain-containing protein [Streptomyces pinistramenti]